MVPVLLYKLVFIPLADVWDVENMAPTTIADPWLTFVIVILVADTLEIVATSVTNCWVLPVDKKVEYTVFSSTLNYTAYSPTHSVPFSI